MPCFGGAFFFIFGSKVYHYVLYLKINISDKEVEALSLVAEAFVSATDAQVSLLVKEGSIVEVQHHE